MRLHLAYPWPPPVRRRGSLAGVQDPTRPGLGGLTELSLSPGPWDLGFGVAGRSLEWLEAVGNKVGTGRFLGCCPLTFWSASFLVRLTAPPGGVPWQAPHSPARLLALPSRLLTPPASPGTLPTPPEWEAQGPPECPDWPRAAQLPSAGAQMEPESWPGRSEDIFSAMDQLAGRGNIPPFGPFWSSF